jgi:hypothetical protein
MGLWYPILNVVKLEIKDSSRPYGARKTVFGRGPRISSGAIFISSLREEEGAVTDARAVEGWGKALVGSRVSKSRPGATGLGSAVSDPFARKK